MDITSIQAISLERADIERLGVPSVWSLTREDQLRHTSVAWQRFVGRFGVWHGLIGLVSFVIALSVSDNFATASRSFLMVIWSAASAMAVVLGVAGFLLRDGTMKPAGLLSVRLRRQIETFNKGLEARKIVDGVARSTATQDLYENDVAQWARRRMLLETAAIDEIKSLLERIEHRKRVAAFDQIGKSLDLLEPLDPQARLTRDYASLALTSQVGEELKKA